MACQNLLAQMLLPSPQQRITVSEILCHPWFLRDLPPGTELVNERLQHDIHARCCFSLQASTPGWRSSG